MSKITVVLYGLDTGNLDVEWISQLSCSPYSQGNQQQLCSYNSSKSLVGISQNDDLREFLQLGFIFRDPGKNRSNEKRVVL